MSQQGGNEVKQDNSTKRTSIAAGTPTLSKTETVFCGATAGVVSRFVIAPLDVVKIRLQVRTLLWVMSCSQDKVKHAHIAWPL